MKEQEKGEMKGLIREGNRPEEMKEGGNNGNKWKENKKEKDYKGIKEKKIRKRKITKG